MGDFSIFERPADARRAIALGLVLVFVQGLAATFLHLEVQEHYYCVEHARVTHDAEHARDASHRAERPTPRAVSTTDRGDERKPTPPTDDEPADDRECQWLTRLHDAPALTGPDSPTPTLTPILLDSTETRDRESQTRAGHPISIVRLAPVNSPPRT